MLHHNLLSNINSHQYNHTESNKNNMGYTNYHMNLMSFQFYLISPCHLCHIVSVLCNTMCHIIFLSITYEYWSALMSFMMSLYNFLTIYAIISHNISYHISTNIGKNFQNFVILKLISTNFPLIFIIFIFQFRNQTPQPYPINHNHPTTFLHCPHSTFCHKDLWFLILSKLNTFPS